jgi:hypothetical protein
MLKIATSLLVALTIPFMDAASACGQTNAPISGLKVGDQVEPWNPLHVAGPDKGTNICPVCTYLEKPVVVVFAKDTQNTAQLSSQLEAIAREHRTTGLRVVIALTDAGETRASELASTLAISDASFCYMSAKTGPAELKAYRINPSAENTIMVYKDYTVAATFVNLAARDCGQVADAVKKLIH